MSNIKYSVEELIGNTPLFEPVAYEKAKGLKARILLKVESVNPLGSLKDRIAVAMLDNLEANTDIKPGDYVVEVSSGNTVIALAALARKRGYKVLALMSQITEERTKLLTAYGAQVVDMSKLPQYTDRSSALNDKIGQKELVEAFLAQQSKIDGNRYFLTAQWTNVANREIQYSTTGQEILRDVDGKIDVLVAGIGSGGSIRGVGDALREANPDLEIIAFDSTLEEPDSIVGVHNIAGRPDFMLPTHVTEKHVYDRTVVVTKEDAYRAANTLAKEEGLFFGISTGAALAVATQLAKQPEYEGKTIVMFAYDDVLKYLSTDLVNPIFAD